MLEKYLYWNEELEVRIHLNNTIILAVTKNLNEQMPNSKNVQRTYSLNETAKEIILLIDGTKTYDEIVSLLSEKYNEDVETISKKVSKFLNDITREYNININEQSVPEKKHMTFVQNRSIYPTVASIEVTNKCNIRCKHCYGNFGERKNITMTLEKVTHLLDDLKDIGVRMIELTGGEIATHPNMKEIVLHAIDLNFDQVSILTNGVALTNEIMDIIISNKSKIFVQIDLQSLNDSYLTWFTNVSNTLPIIQKNIKRLAESNVKMRIATTVTHRNIDEIENIAEWVHSLGIDYYGITPVVSLGRAIDSESDLYITSNDLEKLEATLNKVNNKYKGFLSIIEGDRDKYKNCACLTSHFVISSSGDIKICTMDNLEYFNSSIGNVFEKTIKEIYDDNDEYIVAFYNMTSPKINSPECKECENKFFCSNCVLRGLFKAKEVKEKCSWYKNQVPKIIKDKLEFEAYR